MLYQAGLRAELTRRLGRRVGAGERAWPGRTGRHAPGPAGTLQHPHRGDRSRRGGQGRPSSKPRSAGRLEADERGRVYRLAVLATRAPKDHAGVDDRSLYARWAAEVRDFGVEPAGAGARGPRRARASAAPRWCRRRASQQAVAGSCTAERATFTRREVVQAVARRLDAGDAAAIRVAGRGSWPTRCWPTPRWCVCTCRSGWRCRRCWCAGTAGASGMHPRRSGTRPGRCWRSRAASCTPPQLGRALIVPAGVVEPRRWSARWRPRRDRSAPTNTTRYGPSRAGAGASRLVVGPAGAGKTAMVRVAARAWQDAGYHVIGLAHTAVAAEVLRSEADVGAETVAKFLDWHDRGRRRRRAGGSRPVTWWSSTRPACSPPATSTASASSSCAHGAKLVLVGDDRQLGAVRAPGGMFAALADELGAVELRETPPLHPRLGSPRARPSCAAATATGSRSSPPIGRVHGGSETTARNECFARWWRRPPSTAGTRSCWPRTTPPPASSPTARMPPASSPATSTPAAYASAPRPAPRPSASATSIETRKNDRRLTYGPGPDDWVRNHDRWHVAAVDQRRGTLEVEHLRHHARLTLPADYVAQHVRLGYASTIASAQGLTVDETHVVVSPGMYASELYTALSRGRHANHAYAICDQPGRHATPTASRDVAPTPSQVLARVAQRERPDWAAHSVLRRAMTHPEHPDVIRDRKARSHTCPHAHARRPRARRPRRLRRPALRPGPRPTGPADTSHHADGPSLHDTSPRPRSRAASASTSDHEVAVWPPADRHMAGLRARRPDRRWRVVRRHTEISRIRRIACPLPGRRPRIGEVSGRGARALGVVGEQRTPA